jgi:hypothetical protein
MRFVDNEDPVGVKDGSNREFQLSGVPNPDSSLVVIKNGIVQMLGVDYSVSGSTVTFFEAPQVGDYIRAWYRVHDD